MREWIPEADVIAVTGASPRNLKFWRTKGLLPEIRVRHLGKAHGTARPDYRPWALPIIKRIMAMPRGRGLSLDAYLWVLWLDEDMPSQVTHWCSEGIKTWSEQRLSAVKKAIDAVGEAEVKHESTRKPIRRGPAPIKQIYQRLDARQWYDFMSTVARVAAGRASTATPGFLAASGKLTGLGADQVLPPPGSPSIFDGFDSRAVVASATAEEIATARKLWLRHLGGFDRPAPEPPPSWASILVGDDWRDFPPTYPHLLAGLIAFVVRDPAFRGC